MYSFYGGRPGNSFVIVANFASVDAMITEFQKGSECSVHFDEYVIINTAIKTDTTNGNIYRRGYDYTNEMGGAEYIGNIAGPIGPAPSLELTHIQNITDTGDNHYQQGSYIADGDLVPGGPQNNSIEWRSCCIKNDKDQYVAYIGFKIPYTVIDFEAESISPYSTDPLIEKENEETQNPFYDKWKIKIPKGIKGNSIQNLRIDTTTHQLVAQLVNYDTDEGGTVETIELGDYKSISGIQLSKEGQLTITYSDGSSETLEQTISYINNVKYEQAANNGNDYLRFYFNNDDSPIDIPYRFPKTISFIENDNQRNGQFKVSYSAGGLGSTSSKTQYIGPHGDADLNTNPDNYFKIPKTIINDNYDIKVQYHAGQPQSIGKLKSITETCVSSDGDLYIKYSDSNNAPGAYTINNIPGYIKIGSLGFQNFAYEGSNTFTIQKKMVDVAINSTDKIITLTIPLNKFIANDIDSVSVTQSTCDIDIYRLGYGTSDLTINNGSISAISGPTDSNEMLFGIKLEFTIKAASWKNNLDNVTVGLANIKTLELTLHHKEDPSDIKEDTDISVKVGQLENNYNALQGVIYGNGSNYGTSTAINEAITGAPNVALSLSNLKTQTSNLNTGFNTLQENVNTLSQNYTDTVGSINENIDEIDNKIGTGSFTAESTGGLNIISSLKALKTPGDNLLIPSSHPKINGTGNTNASVSPTSNDKLTFPGSKSILNQQHGYVLQFTRSEPKYEKEDGRTIWREAFYHFIPKDMVRHFGGTLVAIPIMPSGVEEGSTTSYFSVKHVYISHDSNSNTTTITGHSQNDKVRKCHAGDGLNITFHNEKWVLSGIYGV